MACDSTNGKGLRELALFAGAGGGILGGLLCGFRTVCAVEIDPFCREVLMRRQLDGCLPAFPIWDDVRTFDGKPWRGLIDIITGGFPCQDISCAGRGKGIEGERSGLWSEMARIIGEVRPRFAFVENSPMLTSRGLGRVLGDLAEMGYDARWGVLGADNVGGIHFRKRIWIYGSNADIRGLRRSRKNNSQYENGERARKQFEGLLESQTRMAISAGRDFRKSDGMANRVDRLKAIGNGQVSSVVRLAWETLTDGDELDALADGREVQITKAERPEGDGGGAGLGDGGGEEER